jgi:hypothetical protein
MQGIADKFSKLTSQFEPIKIHDNHLEVVNAAKIMGLTLSDDLKWNEHVVQTVKQA